MESQLCHLHDTLICTEFECFFNGGGEKGETASVVLLWFISADDGYSPVPGNALTFELRHVCRKNLMGVVIARPVSEQKQKQFVFE